MICNEELTNEYVFVADDFLPKFLIEEFESIFLQDEVDNPQWTILLKTAYSNKDPVYDFGFALHELYYEDDPINGIVRPNVRLAYGIMATIESKLGIDADHLQRSRVNCTFPVGKEGVTSLYHADYTRKGSKPYTALIYLNDVDGDTILFDQKTNHFESFEENYSKSKIAKEVARVSPKRNRLILFDSERTHNGTYPSKQHRFVTNTIFTTKPGKELSWIS